MAGSFRRQTAGDDGLWRRGWKYLLECSALFAFVVAEALR